MATALDTYQEPSSSEGLEGTTNGTEMSCAGRISHLKGDYWHESAPRKLRSLSESSSPDEIWSVWRKHLQKRAKPKIPELLRTKSQSLSWGVPEPIRGQLAEWNKEILKAGSTKGTAEERSGITQRLTSLEGNSPIHALQCLALAYALPDLAEASSPTEWWGWCDYLLACVTDATCQSVQDDTDPDHALVHQLIAGELGLALATSFPEIAPIRELRKQSSDALSQGILALLDGEGTPQAKYLSVIRPLFACWTRSALMGQLHKKGCWSKEAACEYEWLIRQMIRLSRPNGSLVLSEAQDLNWSSELFATALELAGDDSDSAAADALLPGNIVPEDADFDDDDLPDSSLHSEWSQLAVLATAWSKAAPRITLDYSNSFPKLEVITGRQTLFLGAWDFDLHCNGQPISLVEDWEEQCWQSDEDCDFLELAADLDNGLRLERQLLLAREDQVLYLADNVVAGESDEDGSTEFDFTYQFSLPLAEKIQFIPEKETRDGILVGEKTRAAVLPLALAEWRSQPGCGELYCKDDELIVTIKSEGRRFCCPLLLDLKPRRLQKERTWRQLTVAAQLEQQPHDVAVGFRAQSGKDQWLIYRSLAEAANRTLLGQNLSSEFFAGRFLETGEVDEFIEIEPSTE